MHPLQYDEEESYDELPCIGLEPEELIADDIPYLCFITTDRPISEIQLMVEVETRPVRSAIIRVSCLRMPQPLARRR